MYKVSSRKLIYNYLLLQGFKTKANYLANYQKNMYG